MLGVLSKEEPVLLLKKALAWCIAAQLCGNQDCGLKTRAGEETKKARIELAAAEKVLREYVGEAVTLQKKYNRHRYTCLFQYIQHTE